MQPKPHKVLLTYRGQPLDQPLEIASCLSRAAALKQAQAYLDEKYLPAFQQVNRRQGVFEGKMQAVRGADMSLETVEILELVGVAP